MCQSNAGSVLVRSPRADILERGEVPGVGVRHQLRASSVKVLALTKQVPNLVILPADDPTAAARLVERVRVHQHVRPQRVPRPVESRDRCA